ncbi:MAG: hypothetical protein JWQ49_1488 [Edaphobacter sp.]|nr:hypothetical protein [Edaphobacter sp.]
MVRPEMKQQLRGGAQQAIWRLPNSVSLLCRQPVSRANTQFLHTFDVAYASREIRTEQAALAKVLKKAIGSTKCVGMELTIYDPERDPTGCLRRPPTALADQAHRFCIYELFEMKLFTPPKWSHVSILMHPLNFIPWVEYFPE